MSILQRSKFTLLYSLTEVVTVNTGLSYFAVDVLYRKSYMIISIS